VKLNQRQVRGPHCPILPLPTPGALVRCGSSQWVSRGRVWAIRGWSLTRADFPVETFTRAAWKEESDGGSGKKGKMRHSSRLGRCYHCQGVQRNVVKRVWEPRYLASLPLLA
jgi:hypothetical protein